MPYDLTEDKDLKFDPDKILSLITDKTRLLILINPNNPTGSFVEKPVIDYFAKELEKHPHVTILSDEIYSRQIFDYKEMPSFFHYENLRDRLIAGKVIDFLHIKIGSYWEWYVFNIADTSVSIGMVFFIIHSFYFQEKALELNNDFVFSDSIKSNSDFIIKNK